MSIPTSRPDAPVLLLGGRSWIGYRLAQCLVANNFSVIATTSADTVWCNKASTESACYIQASNGDHYLAAIHKYRPQIIINLLIGIAENDFSNHVAVAKAAEANGSLYVYTSSALALDDYQGEELVESLPPRSRSDYGKFKGRCENHLATLPDLQSLILRFSSIHGWCPWKVTRTESLLMRLAAGEEITVDRGVIQNRMSDTAFAETVLSLMLSNSSGVAHIGTDDSSEEIAFLRRVATEFGYAPNLVRAGEQRSVNLALVPQLGRHPSGGKTEADTLVDIVSIAELGKYKNISYSGESL